ncbi:MAG: hypothetical protein JWN30_1528 [Bacilli bacterium]|nr:hypothetical protein [Bacilli bacterium]
MESGGGQLKNDMKLPPRVLAQLSLLIAGIGWLISLPFRHTWIGGLCFTGFEAGLVGGLADWFAVTALFRHPLGQRWIPHTAIIPHNKDQMIQAIAEVVEKDWLSLTLLEEKLQKFSPLDFLLRLWNPDAAAEVPFRLERLLSRFLQTFDIEKVAAMLDKFIKQVVSGVALSPLLANVLTLTMTSGHDEAIMDSLIDETLLLVQTPDFRDKLIPVLHKAGESFAATGNPFKKLGLWALDRFDVINYPELAALIHERLQVELQKMRYDRTNELRHKIVELLPLWADQLRQNEELIASIESWKQSALQRLELSVPLSALLQSIKNEAVEPASSGPLHDMLHSLFGYVNSQLNLLLADAQKKHAIDNWLKSRMYLLLRQHHHVIGQLIIENLEQLDEKHFVQTIESKVGGDLQWIRINGALVGTLAGVLLFLLTQLLQLLPFIRGSL